MSDYLYIHVPFCLRKCMYCDFLSLPHNNEIEDTYIDALCKELILRRVSAGILRSIYIGGGTPSLLSEKSLEKFFGCIMEHYDLSADCEITLEANPGTIAKSRTLLWHDLGINRVSLGVQSFNDSELRTLGRIHNAEEAMASAVTISETGIDNLSFDLLYGIPGQTIETWISTLTIACRLSPQHISAYELTPEQQTPLGDQIASGGISMPDEDSVLDMFHHSLDYLSSQGFEHYEISNFARPGFSCIHNLNYWDRGEYLCAGPGAHSYINGIRSSNTRDINIYIRQLEAGMIPETEPTKITYREMLREFIFLGLRKTGGISITRAMSLGLDMTGACVELTEEGFLEISRDSIRLTRKGLCVSNTVFVRIFELTGL